MGLVLRDFKKGTGSCTSSTKTWVEDEVADCDFRDTRLHRRFRMLLKQIGGDVGQSIPLVCQDWANTKAVYRFFSNNRVSEVDILSWPFCIDARAVSRDERPYCYAL